MNNKTTAQILLSVGCAGLIIAFCLFSMSYSLDNAQLLNISNWVGKASRLTGLIGSALLMAMYVSKKKYLIGISQFLLSGVTLFLFPLWALKAFKE